MTYAQFRRLRIAGIAIVFFIIAEKPQKLSGLWGRLLSGRSCLTVGRLEKKQKKLR